MHDLNQLARKCVEGQWLYNQQDKTLKKFFASNKELIELNLIDKNGFLDKGLKAAITTYLGDDVLNSGIMGPFGDSDFFSGDIENDEIFYNIELCNISAVTIELLGKISNVFISAKM